MPAMTASRPSSSRYILALVLVGLGGAFSAGVGAVASGLVILSGFLAFEGRPLKRSLAGYLLGGDDLGAGRRKWLSIVDLLMGAVIMTFSLTFDREPPRSTAVGKRGEVLGGTVSHSGGASSCSPGLLPSTVSRGSLEAFLADKGMTFSTNPRGDEEAPLEQVRAYSKGEWAWSFYFDRDAPDHCPARCINMGNVPKGELASTVSALLGREVDFEDQFRDVVIQVQVPGGHVVPVDVDVGRSDPAIREVLLGGCE